MSGDLSYGLEEQAALVSWYVGVWHDLGYGEPPAPSCKAIPPLGERSAEAIKGGHDAVKAIDDLTRQLHGLRAQLVSELCRDADIRGEHAGHRDPLKLKDLRDPDDTEPYCTTCGEWCGLFLGLEGWRHFRGDPAPGGERELYDAGHEPVVGWRPADRDLYRDCRQDDFTADPHYDPTAAWAAGDDQPPGGAR